MHIISDFITSPIAYLLYQMRNFKDNLSRFLTKLNDTLSNQICAS
jgi:hypothetical protein